MPVKWHGEERFKEVDKKVGEALLRIAVLFQTEHKSRLNRSNPKPYKNSSVKGEYPKARTGFGRDATSYSPTSVAEIAQQGQVKLGYLINAWYMGYLEVYEERLGLVKTFESLRGKFKAILDAVGKKGKK